MSMAIGGGGANRVAPDRITLGIELEQFLVNPKTGEIVNADPCVVRTAKQILGDENATYERTKCVAEVGTNVCGDIREADAEVTRLQDGLDAAAREHGLAVMAVSTHPTAHWRQAETTDVTPRYEQNMQKLQFFGRSNVINGMHVHVGFDDPSFRYDIASDFSHAAPIFLALSANSPFTPLDPGIPTGLMASRKHLFERYPRTGTIRWENGDEHRSVKETLKKSGLLDQSDRSEWSQVRVHHTYPTVEIRVCDIPTSREEILMLAGLMQAYARASYRTSGNALGLESKPHVWLIKENFFSAERYGIHGDFIDYRTGDRTSMKEAVRGMVEKLRPDIEALGSAEYIYPTLEKILSDGTGADRQLKVYENALRDEAPQPDREACGHYGASAPELHAAGAVARYLVSATGSRRIG